MEQNSRQVLFGNTPAGSVEFPHAVRGEAAFDREGDGENQQRSDERIRLAVMTALHWDLAVPPYRVRVEVDRGWVTLTGQVARAYESSRAEADARMTFGVAGVTNKIERQRTA